MSLRNYLLFFVLVGSVFSAPVGIVSCQEISAPGEYALKTDLTGTDGANNYCIKISAADVVLDCAGHSITAEGGGTYGILIGSATSNSTVRNCTISSYEYGVFSEGKGTTLLWCSIHDSTYEGIRLAGGYNTLANNAIYGNGLGASVYGSGNAIFLNMFYENEREGLVMEGGKSSDVYLNTAYNNGGSGFDLSGNDNVIRDNTAYGNDWSMLSGAGFEIYGAGNTIGGNEAYNNTNGFYIEAGGGGPLYGNDIGWNNAHGNLIGLNLLDYNSTVQQNTLEENTMADLLIGGDAWLGGLKSANLGKEVGAEMMCLNTIKDNTGSGGRPIYYSSTRVALNGGTYSEIILCNATGSTIRNVAVSGSSSLKNNGLLLLMSEGVSIESTTSKGNFMGFGILRSDEVSVKKSDASGSGLGVVSIGSENLLLEEVSASSNRMDSSTLLQLLEIFLGEGALGEPEGALRGTSQEIPENGFSAVLFNSDYAQVVGSSFSGSTGGLLFINTHDATVTGGSAYSNSLFGYGMIDCSRMLFENVKAYSNNGTLEDVTGGSEVPPGFEFLASIPPGTGIIDLSMDMLVEGSLDSSMHGIIPICITDRDCREGQRCIDGRCMGIIGGCTSDLQCIEGYFCFAGRCIKKLRCEGDRDCALGYFCDVNTGFCTPQPFDGNFYAGVRSYGNNYGMVFLAKGNEWVNGSRIYDNRVLGIIDAANPNEGGLGASGMPPSPTPEPSLIAVTNTYTYRNGEGLFAVLAELSEENGHPAWASAFRAMDRQIPKGAIELEMIEASRMWEELFLPPKGSVIGYPWYIEEETLGSGTPAVTISLDDDAEAIYALGDTTIPSLRSIHLFDREAELDTTIYFDFEAPRGKRPFQGKNFMIVAIGPGGKVVTPEIDDFWVHYGSPAGYDEDTMGLYYLDITTIAPYCSTDADCEKGICYNHMCINPQCESDADCFDPLYPYCSGYRCVSCKEDANCRKDCYVCTDGQCGAAECTADSDCGERCVCENNFCIPALIESAGGDAGCRPALREETLRADTGGTALIIKGRWVPVQGQALDKDARTIYASGLSQKERTDYLERILGIDFGDDMRIYLDIYGLFAVYKGEGEEGGEAPQYACEVDGDCPECYFCGIANNQCLPKSSVECGVPGKECPRGYRCEGCSCAPPECLSDSQCGEGYVCREYSCMKKPQEPSKPPEADEKEGKEEATPVVKEIQLPEEEKPPYQLVQVEVPSVQAPKYPVSETQARFQQENLGLAFLLLLGIVAAYFWFRMTAHGGKGK
ncbi:MAG: right-handed parallel beta-helix repeat-containing protein [Candidatus Bilamarchaeaceae archaeon]